MANAVFSQTSLPPFVSRLTAVKNDGGILVTWKDADGAEGNYMVYSHGAEIDEESFSKATLLESVPADTQRYLHIPQTEGPHYYAVLASDADGTVFKVFVPYRNKTTRGIRAEIITVEAVQPITAIDASVVEDAVMLNFEASKGEDIVIYRGTEPIGDISDLLDAVLLEATEATDSPYSDRPLPGIPYYYGVFYDSELRTGNTTFAPGENVLTDPVEIPLAVSETTEKKTFQSRSRPLPFLMISSTVDTGESLKSGPYEAASPVDTLAPATRQAVDRLLENGGKSNGGSLVPEWLPSDESGELFKELLSGHFEEGEWDEALGKIDNYLQIRRSSLEEQRARFYRGQCYYFLGKYEESFLEFIFAEEGYYPQVQPWLDDLITLLAAL